MRHLCALLRGEVVDHKYPSLEITENVYHLRPSCLRHYLIYHLMLKVTSHFKRLTVDCQTPRMSEPLIPEFFVYIILIEVG